MITNETKLNALTDAAMEIFKVYQKGEGFYSGKKIDEETGRTVPVFNDWDAGLRRATEYKLGRGMTPHEQTVLSLAVGKGPTPSLTKAERKYSMEFLWGEEFPLNEERRCHDLMKILTCF